MLKLTEQERSILHTLKSERILVDVDGHKLNTDGVILVVCSDGDQFCDKFNHLSAIFSTNGHEPRIHTFGWNGGALRLLSWSPANKRQKSFARACIQEIEDANTMKKWNLVVLYIHAPCGKARDTHIDVLKSHQIMFEAKRVIKQQNSRFQVACFTHVDWGNSKRTYFANDDVWNSRYQKT